MIMNVDQLSKHLGLSIDDTAFIEELFLSVPPQVVAEWYSGLKLRNGGIAGTYYAGLSAVVSFDKFIRLYELFGYKFETLSDHWNQECTNFPAPYGCHIWAGKTCDPNYCH